MNGVYVYAAIFNFCLIALAGWICWLVYMGASGLLVIALFFIPLFIVTPKITVKKEKEEKEDTENGEE